MTPLDEVLLAAQNDPSRVDPFYSLFLATNLFVPIYDRPAGDLEAPMRPIVIPDGAVQFIPVFDALDKLVNWAQQEVEYMQMEARAFLEGLHPSVHLALNPGDDLFKEFVPEEIQWLRSGGAQVPVAPVEIQRRIEAPKRIPFAMQSKFFEFFREHPEIQAAHLAKCQYKDRPAGWILVLETKPEKATFEPLSEQISAALQGTLGSQVSLEILPKRGESLDLSVTAAVPPFYVKSAFL